MAEYITLPIEVDPAAIVSDFVAYLKLQWPDWEPADGNLDSWLAQAIANDAAELRELASQVPTTIFRYFGATIVNVPPLDSAPAFASTTWTVINNLGYTIRAGTQVGIPAAGDDLIPFEVIDDVVISPGNVVTAAGEVQLVALTPGADGTNLGGPGSTVQLLDPLDFVTGVTLTAATSGGADAEDDDVYLTRLMNELKLLTPRPILPVDFAILAKTIVGVARAVALDGYNPYHNWLTANASSIETDATGWVNDTNITVARSTAQFADGVASLSMTATALATMDARSAQAIAVAAGETWTALASIRANTTVRSARVGIRWYSDGGGATVISTSFGAAINDINTGWTNYLVTAQAPANALSARVIIEVTTPAAAEVHYADKMSLRRGSTTDWVIGGTAETGNGRMVTVGAVDETGVAVSSAIKNSIQTLLLGLRETNFVVNLMDPNYTSIDVNVTVHVASGYSSAQVQADVVSALQSYLSPATWGKDPVATDSSTDSDWNNVTVVRLFELAQAINNVSGVDYIVTGTLQMRYGTNAFAAADVTLPGVLPLPQAGVMTVGTA